jgi:small GTP-binding protein
MGDFAVGKTSLVNRLVHSLFTDKFQTTVGVNIDSKECTLETGEQVKLVLWDIAGGSTLSQEELRYLHGTSSYILVVDGTRAGTLQTALNLDKIAQTVLGSIPRILLFNKYDLLPQWEIQQGDIDELQDATRPQFLCSALTGERVETAFQTLAEILTND